MLDVNIVSSKLSSLHFLHLYVGIKGIRSVTLDRACNIIPLVTSAEESTTLARGKGILSNDLLSTILLAWGFSPVRMIVWLR